MEASHVLSEKQRQFFRRDFYGRLIVETREGASRAYFAEESPDGVPWEPWHVVSRSGNTLQVQLVMAGKVVVRSIALDGDCYRVDQSSLAFGEWFCRAP